MSKHVYLLNKVIQYLIGKFLQLSESSDVSLLTFSIGMTNHLKWCEMTKLENKCFHGPLSFMLYTLNFIKDTFPFTIGAFLYGN